MTDRIGIEYLGEKELQSFQLEKLNELLAYLLEKSPYYRDLLHEIRLNGIQNLDDLKQIPITEKVVLAENQERFSCVSADEIIEYTTTSGTLGKPLSVCLTEKDVQRLAYNEVESLKKAGCTSKDIIQLSTTMDKRFMAGMAYYEGVRSLGAGLIRVGASAPALQWDSILRFKPTAIIAIPAFLLSLLDYAHKNGIDPKKSSVKKLIAIGQPIRRENLELNVIGQRIKDEWGIEIYSTYASTEMATAFTECEHGLGGHLQPDLVFVEVVDENGNEVADGTVGEIVVSTFGMQAMPLLRYRTGDIAHVYRSQCKCGRTTLRLGPILGRKNHMVKFKGTTVHPSALLPLLDNNPKVRNYFVALETDSLGMDDLKVVFSDAEITTLEAADIVREIGQSINVTPTYDIIASAEMSSLIHDAANRKPVRIIDRRSK